MERKLVHRFIIAKISVLGLNGKELFDFDATDLPDRKYASLDDALYYINDLLYALTYNDSNPFLNEQDDYIFPRKETDFFTFTCGTFKDGYMLNALYEYTFYAKGAPAIDAHIKEEIYLK